MPLFVIATPIGNYQDLSPRAISALKQAELILAEDTKKTRALLGALGIAVRGKNSIKRCDSYAEEKLRTDKKFSALLVSDAPVALVSDAGTPAVADPGAQVVALAAELGIRTIPVPGASAVTAALSISGFTGNSFTFGGYLPNNSNERQDIIRHYRDRKETVVFYETPHRIAAALADLCDLWGADRQALLARELTKDYETLYRGTLQQLQQQLTPAEHKGEMVIVLQGAKSRGASKNKDELSTQDQHMLNLLMQHLPLKTAAILAAQLSDSSKKDFYAAGLLLKSK